MCGQREIERAEEERAMAKIKCGISAGIDTVTPNDEIWMKCRGKVDEYDMWIGDKEKY